MLGGKGEKKKTDSKSTGLTGSKVGLSGAPTCLTGIQTHLTCVSREPGSSSKTKNKTKAKF